MNEEAFGIIPFYKDTDGLKVFLIHQYGSGGDMLWTFPKGRPNDNESPLETAIRECKEETGISPDQILSTHPLSTSYAFERKGVWVEKRSTYYIGLVKDLSYSVQPEEVKEAGWFKIDDARTQLTFPDYKQLLEEALILLDNL